MSDLVAAIDRLIALAAKDTITEAELEAIYEAEGEVIRLLPQPLPPSTRPIEKHYWRTITGIDCTRHPKRDDVYLEPHEEWRSRLLALRSAGFDLGTDTGTDTGKKPQKKNRIVKPVHNRLADYIAREQAKDSTKTEKDLAVEFCEDKLDCDDPIKKAATLLRTIRENRQK